jgi:hypothetical protein
MTNTNKKWLAEYEVFLQSENLEVPSKLTSRVFLKLAPLINPNPFLVFFKILTIHVCIGFISLSVCHQFGMNPFGTNMSLDQWFMAMWGHSVCMILCGVLFTGLSFLSAGFLLRIEEVRVLKKTEILQNFCLGLISLLIFFIFGAELELMYASLWFFGALIGSYMAMLAVLKLKHVSF